MRVRGDDNRVFAALWSAVDLYRVLVLAYVIYLYIARLEHVAHPQRGWWVLSVLAVWTVCSLLLPNRGRWWYVAELVLATAAVLATMAVDSRAVIQAGSPTVPGMWPAATVLAWAVRGGTWGGLIAAGVIAVADLVLIQTPNATTIHHIVILLLVGSCVGYCADLVRQGYSALQEALALTARAAERERLAATVHDGVLQALTFINRRGHEVGGEAAQLGDIAGQQERVLRELISAPTALEPAPRTPGEVDLRGVCTPLAGERVTVSVPAEPVLVQADQAAGVRAAMDAALENVRVHAGAQARAWVLLEDEGDHVIVTVRDDGPGIAPGRLEAARAENRLGVAVSIVARLEALGGSALYRPSRRGTVVELQLPKESVR